MYVLFTGRGAYSGEGGGGGGGGAPGGCYYRQFTVDN